MAFTHKEITRKLYVDVWNGRKLDVLEQVIAKTHGLNDPTLSGAAVGPEAYKKQVERFVAGFPDLRFVVDDTISEKDKLVVAWTINGTHRGEFLNVEPTNKKISFSGITINQISDGKIIESQVMWDIYGLFQQMGITLPAKTAKRAMTGALR